MPLTIAPANPKDPQAAALLEASHALMESLFPPDENHFLDLDALCADNIRFFAASEDGQPLGCAALAIKDGYGELKSMFVAPEARGLGVAARLLAHVEEQAAQMGLPLLRLETGDKLLAAVQLYEKSGFSRVEPFGEYTPNTSSLFFEKALS